MITRIPLAACLCLLALLSSSVAHAGPPEDAGAYHLITITEPSPSPSSQALLHAIDHHPRVSGIAKACKTFRWNSSTPIYRERYAAALPPTTLPIIALARSDGGVIWKASGVNVPSGDALADALVARAYQDRKTNPRAMPGAQSAAVVSSADRQLPGLLRRPLEGVIPDTITIEHDASGLPWVPLGIAGVAGFLLFAGLAIGCLLLVVVVIFVVIKIAS